MLLRLTYLLAVTHFSRECLNKIQAKFIPAFLNAGQFSANLPRVIIFAPKWLGGIGLRDIFFKQVITQTKLFNRLVRTKSELKKLLRICLDYFLLHVGSATCPYSHPMHLCYVPQDWFLSLHKFLHKTKGSLSMTVPVYFEPKCEEDSSIMDNIRASNFSDRWVVACSWCWLHLQALTVSNICNAMGTKILPQALHCTGPIPSHLWWPQQEPPSATDRKIWKTVLTKLYLQSSKLRMLRNPLS